MANLTRQLRKAARKFLELPEDPFKGSKRLPAIPKKRKGPKPRKDFGYVLKAEG